MKSILLVRHAKSSWNFDVDDFDRPLNDRGNRDAPAMAERLMQNSIVIDAIVTSPAKRALTTARYFADSYKMPKTSINVVDALYEPELQKFFATIETLDNKYNTVALFSHNPGITEFANSLTTSRIDDMPTCGILALRINTENWQQFRIAEKTFWFFDAPKL